VRDDVGMSDADLSHPRPDTPGEGQGVLANLPRTRPQRSSPRRAAARKTTAAAAGASGTATAAPRGRSESARRKPTTPKAPTGKRTRSTAGRPGSSPSGQDAAPRQGFEADGETMSGTVLPPGGAELVASAAEIVGELTKAGLSSGERLLRDVFSRLRPS
jgi:hypothetical protein